TGKAKRLRRARAAGKRRPYLEAFFAGAFLAGALAAGFGSAFTSGFLAGSALTSAALAAGLGSALTSTVLAAGLGSAFTSGFLAGSALTAAFFSSVLAAFLAGAFLAAFGAGFSAAAGAAFFSSAGASAFAFAAAALALALGLRVTSAMVQNWLSPLTSAQICRPAPLSVAMPTTSRHLPARFDLILTRPSLPGSTIHSWLLAGAPSHWWTAVPSQTPPAYRSSILPVKIGRASSREAEAVWERV